MTVALMVAPQSISTGRWTLISFLVWAAASLTLLWPHAVSAQTLAVGARAACDPTGLKKYYQLGTVIPFHPGETYNGYAAGSGYFYRFRVDGGDADGTLCKTEDMRAAAPPAPRAAAPMGARPAAAPAPARVAQGAPRPGMGGKFGTREPRTCAPLKTMPNTAQIKALLQCQWEGKTPYLITLLEHITVQAGTTRRYNHFADHMDVTIDPNAPVLPIRGSYDRYQCAAITVPKGGPGSTVYDTDNTGKNCQTTPERNATGSCYRTTFGDWKCNMQAAPDPSLGQYNQPPP